MTMVKKALWQAAPWWQELTTGGFLPPHIAVVLEAEAREEAVLNYQPQGPPLRDLLLPARSQVPSVPLSPKQHLHQGPSVQSEEPAGIFYI